MMMKNKEIKSLYIHIPFCEHICDYCDFSKLQYFRLFAEKYLIALKQELEFYKVNKHLKTIYIGGGTPTALEDDLFEQLLVVVDEYRNDVIEYTVEANPESLSLEKLEMMKAHGVNRISLGVESTDDEILKSINRHHTYKDVQIAISNTRKVGFDNLNVDLIIGLPGVNKASFKRDLDRVLSLDVEHVSCYSLTVHPNTVFGIKGTMEPSEGLSRELYDIAEETLKGHGYIHYEVSNWSKEGRTSLHNFTYWKNEPYYGVGLGVSGYVNSVRYTNTRNIKKYFKGDYVEEKNPVTLKDDKFYTIMLNLRTIEGIDLNQYQAVYREDLLEKYQTSINRFIKDGYLVYDKKEHRLFPTYEGMMILDQIIMELTE